MDREPQHTPATAGEKTDPKPFSTTTTATLLLGIPMAAFFLALEIILKIAPLAAVEATLILGIAYLFTGEGGFIEFLGEYFLISWFAFMVLTSNPIITILSIVILSILYLLTGTEGITGFIGEHLLTTLVIAAIIGCTFNIIDQAGRSRAVIKGHYQKHQEPLSKKWIRNAFMWGR